MLCIHYINNHIDDPSTVLVESCAVTSTVYIEMVTVIYHNSCIHGKNDLARHKITS